MEGKNNVDPRIVVKIGGQEIAIECNYRTIYDFEKLSGKSIFDLASRKSLSFGILAEFLTAAIAAKNPKVYSVNWVLDNMTPKLFAQLRDEIIPQSITYAFIDETKGQEADEEAAKKAKTEEGK